MLWDSTTSVRESVHDALTRPSQRSLSSPRFPHPSPAPFVNLPVGLTKRQFTNINRGSRDRTRGCETRVSARPFHSPPFPPSLLGTPLASPLLFNHATSHLPLRGVHRSAPLPIPCPLFRRTPMECESIIPSWQCRVSARPPVHLPTGVVFCIGTPLTMCTSWERTFPHTPLIY